MPYDSIISRTDAGALIPEEVASEILQSLPQYSTVRQLATTVPMSTHQQRMPALAALAYAYFVNGDTGLKQTTELAWENRYLNVEEIAAIVPVPESVLADAEFDIWAQVRPRIAEAIGRVLDAAVLFGVNKPASWPGAIVPAATSAGHAVSIADHIDIVDAVGGEGGIMAKVEEDGFDVTGFIGYSRVRAMLRGARSADGDLIYHDAPALKAPSTLYGLPLAYPRNGSWQPESALLVAGDWSQLLLGIRQDITIKRLDQAVIQDGSGNIVFNLAQQDMIALRAVMRVAFTVANPITNLQPDEASRYPFSVLTP